MRESYIAKNVATLPPSGIRRFFDIAAGMRDCISLGVGEPDFVTPWAVRDAAIYSIDRGHTHYTSNWGTAELRELIARYLRERCELFYAKENVLVTVGASEALDLAFRTLIEPGDEVLIPAPCYVSYMPSAALCHGVGVPIPVREEEGFKLTPGLIEQAVTERTKAVILPYPNNPTGAVMTREDYEAIAPVIEKYDLAVISDEIYSELTYAGSHFSPARLPQFRERTVVINGFSKAFAMTGWRLGYAAAPAELISAMCRIHQYTMLCAPVMSQAAGVEALSSELACGFANVSAMVREYNRRRMLIVGAFREMGIPCHEPLGAFYAFPNISGFGMSSEEFCEKLLYEQKVACVPGTAFGEAGEGFMRCSYASSVQNLKEAAGRIAKFIGGL